MVRLKYSGVFLLLIVTAQLNYSLEDSLDKIVQDENMDKKAAIDCKTVKKCNTRLMNFTEDGKEYICKQLMEKEHKVYTVYKVPSEDTESNIPIDDLLKNYLDNHDAVNALNSKILASHLPHDKNGLKYIVLGTLLPTDNLISLLDNHIKVSLAKHNDPLNVTYHTKEFSPEELSPPDRTDSFFNQDEDLINRPRAKGIQVKRKNVKVDFFNSPNKKEDFYDIDVKPKVTKKNISCRPLVRRITNMLYLLNNESSNAELSSTPRPMSLIGSARKNLSKGVMNINNELRENSPKHGNGKTFKGRTDRKSDKSSSSKGKSKKITFKGQINRSSNHFEKDKELFSNEDNNESISKHTLGYYEDQSDDSTETISNLKKTSAFIDNWY